MKLFQLLFLLPFAFCNKNIFGPNVELYQKPDDNLSFGYSKEKVCSLRQYSTGQIIYGSIRDAFTFEESALKPIIKDQVNINKCRSKSMIQGCFRYNHHSYVLCKNDNTTYIKRNNEPLRSFDLTYRRFVFDHQRFKAYLLMENGQLMRFNLDIIDQNISHLTLFDPNPLVDFGNLKILDLIVFDDKIYYIMDKVRKRRLVTYNSSTLVEPQITRPDFHFIPFNIPHEKANNTAVKVIENCYGGLFIILLYILDFAFFVILLFFYRKDGSLSKTKNKQFFPLIDIKQ